MTARLPGAPLPERDPRTTRHDTRLLRRAKQLRAGGWTPNEVRQRLAVEFELERPPSETTIRSWTEPGYRELHRKWQLKSERQPGKPGRFLTDDVLLAMRVEDRMAYPAISAVVKRFFNVDLAPEVIRRRLYKLGVEKNANKIRAGVRLSVRNCGISPGRNSQRAENVQS